MSQSNERARRKHYAEMVENELLTINVELETLHLKLKAMSFNDLKRINANRLIDIRDMIQRLKSDVKRTNKYIDELSKPDWGGSTVLNEDGREILVPIREFK